MLELLHKWKTRYKLWHYNRTLRHNYQIIQNYLLELYAENDEQKCWKIIFNHVMPCIRVIHVVLLHGGPNAQLNALRWKKLKNKIASYRYSSRQQGVSTFEPLEDILHNLDELLVYYADPLIRLKEENSSSHS